MFATLLDREPKKRGQRGVIGDPCSGVFRVTPRLVKVNKRVEVEVEGLLIIILANYC